MSDSIKEKSILVTGILVYLSFAIYVAYLFKIGNSSPASYLDIINALRPIAAFMSVIACIDAVLLVVFEGSSKLLILFAVFLLPFYPLYRDKVYGGKINLGALLTAVFFIGLVAVMIFAVKSASSYGQLTVNVTDKETLDEAMALLDSEAIEGKTYSDLLIKKGKFSPTNASVSKSGSKTVIVLNGSGTVDVSEKEAGYYSIDTVNGAPTNLTFEKKSSGTEYTLKKVEVSGRTLSEKEMKFYYNKITGN